MTIDYVFKKFIPFLLFLVGSICFYMLFNLYVNLNVRCQTCIDLKYNNWHYYVLKLPNQM